MPKVGAVDSAQEEKMMKEFIARFKALVEASKECVTGNTLRYGISLAASFLQDLVQHGGQLSAELLDPVKELVNSYIQRICLPDWDLQGLLTSPDLIQTPIFVGGGLVLHRSIADDSPEFAWVQGMIRSTFRNTYTRDRGKGKVPKGLKLRALIQVFNCGSWHEYWNRSQQVAREMSEKGAAWEGELKTEAPSKFLSPPGIAWASNVDIDGSCQRWLFHGTSASGAIGITSSDFKISLAGSAAGTLYGRGIYLAECSSKSDEYTVEDEGAEGLRSLLLCRACLGRTYYTDEDFPDVTRLERRCQTSGGEGYHSVLGDREKSRGTYREIIVYDDNQVYPAYICHYEREY